MESLFILVTGWCDPIIKPASFFLVFLLSCTMVSDMQWLVQSLIILNWDGLATGFVGKIQQIQYYDMRTINIFVIYIIYMICVDIFPFHPVG